MSMHTSQGQSRIQAFLEINLLVFSYLKVILEAFFQKTSMKSLAVVYKPTIQE